MKPIVLALVLLAGTLTQSFARETPRVEPAVLRSFQNTFAAARDVDWSQRETLYQAVFFLSGQYLTAYYNSDGNLQALTRHIAPTGLPVILQTALKNEHKEQWISDVFEVTADGVVQYYVTLEDATQQLVLKSASTSWITFQKNRKD